MSEERPADDRYEATIGALAQIVRELIEARVTIVQQQQEIEQLRSVASTAFQAKEKAMSQVRQALARIKDTRLHAAQAKDALKVERAERTRLSHELASITEQVGILLGVMPMQKLSVVHNSQAAE